MSAAMPLATARVLRDAARRARSEARRSVGMDAVERWSLYYRLRRGISALRAAWPRR